MLRIHFGWRDLENVRLAQQPDPLWELMCAVCRLQTDQGPLEFGHWRRRSTHLLSRDSRADTALRTLRTFIPATGYIPDFLTPPVTGDHLDAALERVRATPRERLVAELTLLAAEHAEAAVHISRDLCVGVTCRSDHDDQQQAPHGADPRNAQGVTCVHLLGQ